MAPPTAAAAVVASMPDRRNTTTPTATATGGAINNNNKGCHVNEDTIKLIECVKARPALWHRKHLRQRVQVAHRGWEEIRKAFKATEVTSLKVRWKTLRDSFRREVKRIEDGEIKISNWPMFDRMSFLIGHFRTRESYYKSGSQSPEQAREPPETEEELSNAAEVASSSVAEGERETLEMVHVYPSSQVEMYEAVVTSNTDFVAEARAVSGAATSTAAADSDPEELTLIETYEAVQEADDDDDVVEDMEIEPSRSDEVIELPPHMYGEVTFKNKLRARIKTEPVDSERRSVFGGGDSRGEVDSDYSFLMSLHPFMRKLSGKRNLEVRIKIQQLIADAMEED